VSKGYFEDAVRWLEIHGGPDGRELAARWRELAALPVPAGDEQAQLAPHTGPEAGAGGNGSRRRRRRRRRRRPRSEPAAPA
jgi:hypothetical protein